MCGQVVHDPRPDAHAGQRFFKGHDERVSTVTIAWGNRVSKQRMGVLAASGQVAAKMLGQDDTGEELVTGHHGHRHQHSHKPAHAHEGKTPGRAGRKHKGPYVCVWDTRRLYVEARLGFYHQAFYGDITSLSFSGDGQRLAVLCADRRHTLSVWNWEQDMIMAQTSTHQYPTTHVAYSPYCLPLRNGGRELLATFGRRHIRFWTLQGLEGAASLSGAPPVDPDRLAGGDPRLNVWDATNAKLPLQPRRDNSKSKSKVANSGRVGPHVSSSQGVVGKGRSAPEGIEEAGGEEEETDNRVSSLRPQGVSMEEAGSEEYLKQRWAQKREGFLAGGGESVLVNAQETSNRWKGKSFAAEYDKVTQKWKAITDSNVVGDPGALNSGWEPGTMLSVVRGRPEFDSKAITKHALQRMERVLASFPFSCQLHGRSGMFELPVTRSIGDFDKVPVDALSMMNMVEANRLPQNVALDELAKHGWRKGVLARYMAGGNSGETKARQGGSTWTPSGARNRNAVALAGSLRRSVLEKDRLDVPEFVTSGGWFCVYQDQDIARQSAFQSISYRDSGDKTKHYFICAGTNGRVYRFFVDLFTEGSPVVQLEDSKECHEGPIYALQVFKDGSFFSGGRDCYLRFWNPEIKIAWEMERDNMRSEWQMRNAITNLHVLRAEMKPRGVELENAVMVVMTENRELHRFPLEPAKYRQVASEWSPSSLYAVVWSWKDALNLYREGLSTTTTCVHSAAPMQPAPSHGGGGSGGGGTLGKTPGSSQVEGQICGIALHPIRDEYALVIHSAIASSVEAAGARAHVERCGGCVGAIQLVGSWEDKQRTNMSSSSQVTYLPAGALCVDYSVDGSCVGVGLSSGDVVFVSSQTASVLHTLPASPSGSAVRKLRFSACGLMAAVALESRDIVVIKIGEGSFSDDSRLLKSVVVTASAQGHSEAVQSHVLCSSVD